MKIDLEEILAGIGRTPRHIAHPEDNLQTACVEWFRYAHRHIAPLLFHPNNEAYTGGSGRNQRRGGARLKAMGVVAGVADLILLHPGAEGQHALAVEMKSAQGRQSPAQREWQRAAEAVGVEYRVVRTLEDFIATVNGYLGQ